MQSRICVIFTFDFKIKSLEEYYSANNPKSAYQEVRNYLVEKGFVANKDSDYYHPTCSITEVIEMVENFSANNRWFKHCLTKSDISQRVLVNDICSVLSENLPVNEFELLEKEKQQRDSKRTIRKKRKKSITL